MLLAPSLSLFEITKKNKTNKTKHKNKKKEQQQLWLALLFRYLIYDYFFAAFARPSTKPVASGER